MNKPNCIYSINSAFNLLTVYYFNPKTYERIGTLRVRSNKGMSKDDLKTEFQNILKFEGIKLR